MVNKSSALGLSMPVSEEEITGEMIKLDLLEDADDEAMLDIFIGNCMEDYPDDDQSEMAQHVARIARHTARWDPKVITRQTPYDIQLFIMHKYGPKSDGYEGQKYTTTISTCAALTLWFHTLRPQERMDEWVIDEAIGQCSGLPICACIVSEFMLGLKKMKSKSGEVSQICPKHALIHLAQVYGRTLPKTGPLFLQVNNYGAVMGKAITTPMMTFSLAADLQGLGYKSWSMYGTKSFHRGMLAAWGGWSQLEAVTIFCYFYSPNDNHEHMVDYDFNDGKWFCF
ncbi:hypothetical protein PAXRUDRAFT_781159 [Paxillus rubicundulus Ve08.2h10]|uniref:Uncharacterized protein n=1 Tax=Paxillus rubicundulus Ve08.2h10 TaxID=930991 RepID=A0A0D0DXP5_9AGAM|nr:hypothetical protein PAXRUDRAFT_781159 [Paxillus rubicundulus Ve08.2h10]